MGEPEAAVAIVQASKPEESVLLMRRAEREGDSWSGHWSFPGGRRSPEDPDMLHTALRELEEECGVHLHREELREPLPLTIARRRVGPYLTVAPFVFRVADQLATVPDPRETAQAVWIPTSLLKDPQRHCLRPVPGVASNVLFPSIDLPGAPLWGFTYRLITDWLSLAPREENTGALAVEQVLEFLAARGIRTETGGKPRHMRVGGVIPADEVLAFFSQTDRFLPAINRLTVSRERIVIAGPEYEEYVIEAEAT